MASNHERRGTEMESPTDTETCQDMGPVVAMGTEELVGGIPAELQVAPIPQNAPANLVLSQTSTMSTNITNVVDNRQINLSQHTVNHPHPMEVGTLIGGKHNLNLKADGHSTVNIYTGMKEEKPCHMPTGDEVGDEIQGLPKGADAIPPVAYNKLLFDIIEHLEENGKIFRRVKYYCRSDWGTRHGIPPKLLVKMEPEKFIECLEQCQLLGPYNLEFLYELMKESGQTDLAGSIDDFKNKHENDRLQKHKPNGTKAEDKFHAELVLNGDISQRTYKDVDRCKETFQERLDIPKSAANFIGTGDGSVVLVFQLPLRWPCEKPGEIGDIDVRARLTDDVSQRADWLNDSDVIGIHIEGQEYVDLTGVSPTELHDITEEALLGSLGDGDGGDVRKNDSSDILESSTDKQTTISTEQKSVEDSSVLSTVGSTYFQGGREAISEQQQQTQNITEDSYVEELVDIMQEEFSKLAYIQHRIDRLQSHEIRYLPQNLKTFVKDLQRDIMKVAAFMAEQGQLVLAINWYSSAIEVGEYAINVGYSPNNAQTRNIILSRVECAMEWTAHCQDKDVQRNVYSQCIRDCKTVFTMDKDDKRAQRLIVAAVCRQQQMSKDVVDCNRINALKKMIDALPKEEYTHPMIKDYVYSIMGVIPSTAKASVKESKNDLFQGTAEKSKSVGKIPKIRKKKGKHPSKKQQRKTIHSDSGFDTGNTSTGEDFPKRHGEKPMYRSATDSESGIGSAVQYESSSESDTDALSCSYCHESFNDDQELELHITSSKHKTKLNSDRERSWNFRSPPLSVINGNYQLCERYEKSKCPFSNVSAVNNSCTMAHGKDELQEWKDRHKYRKMKMHKASQQKLFSFLDDLQLEYYLADKQIEIMTEKEPEYAQIEYQPSNLTPSIQISEVTDDLLYTYKWTFTIKTLKHPLKRIGLLHDAYRIHFQLMYPGSPTKAQICPGDQACPLPTADSTQYTMGVTFRTHMLGKFEQWIVFDFDDKPVVFHKLVVRIGSDACEEDNSSPAIEPVQIWDSSNSDIVPFCRNPTRFEKNLGFRYRLSELDNEAGILDRENYQHFMHVMLKTEERERTNLLTRFGMAVEMTIKHTIHLKSRKEVMTYESEAKQLFGRIDLTHALHDDTSASQIVLTGVQYVLIKLDPSSEKIYEAKILRDRDMEDKQTVDELYVILSSKCVQQLGLAAEQKKDVEIQFQLDRHIFLLMHQAIERMTSTEYIFPTENPNPALICPQERSSIKEADSPSSRIELNKWQEAAARFISSKGGSRDHTPLLLLYGPFGTGKTFTIASAVMETLRKLSKPHPEYIPRILICTHSNSAADLYLTHYFDDFMSECKAKKVRIMIRRVYATSHNVRSIPSKVRPYINTERGRLKIDADVIKRCNLVITTTSTASRLSIMLPKDHFSHILIDEAGQVLETEAIIPLTLATRNTCVVLAGDHVQMGPVVYSKEARNRHFHHSLLERLFEYSSSNNCHRHIIFADNYRSCAEILNFLSQVFYQARHLQALGNQPIHPDYYPLEFREVLGEDEVLGNSYVNNFEADEITRRVKELKENWPTDLWGNFDQSTIGVLTPYTLQVRKIRKKLRTNGYGDVTVERVQNVQGKEYRVVLISTVRTRKTIACSQERAVDDCTRYLGFLSDSRQLNTAFTRAKSLVVVVGNPIALCSIGKCSTVWQRYITKCEKEKSYYGDLNKDDIISAIQSLNPSMTSEVCNSTRTTTSELLPQCTKSSEGQSLSVEKTWDRASRNDDNIQTSMTMDPLMKLWKTETSVSSDTDESEDEEIRRPDLLRALRRESRKRVGEVKGSDETDSEVDDARVDESREYRMVDDEDEVRLEEVEIDDAETSQEIQDKAIAHPVGDKEQIKKYGEDKICTFRVDFDGNKYAVPIDDAIGAEEILISTNTQRGTALDGDIVRVQVEENPEYLQTDNEPGIGDELPLYGRVVDIEKRALDMTMREIVCYPDLFTDNLMVPVDRTLPKIFILRPRADRGQKRNDKVLIIPICRFRNRRVVLHKDVNVTTKERANKLFVVRWVSWEPGFTYPLGLVIEDLPKNTNETTGLNILRRIYSVPEELDNDNDHELNFFRISREEFRRREDYRAAHVITIDPENALDYDDALSINDRLVGYPPGYYNVCIHVSDVTHFVQQNDDIDLEARDRATSYYPENNDPIHMLPPLLSTNVCSLKKNEDRLALSLCFVADQNNDIIDDVDPVMKSSVVRCKDQLTYDEAEGIIKGKTAGQKETRECILRLHQVALRLKEKRLGSTRFASSYDGHAASTPQSHILIEELMIRANQQIAQYLLESFPNLVPVRRQLPPEAKKLHEWCDNHRQNIPNSTYLLSEKDFLCKRVGEHLEFELPSDSVVDNTIDIHKNAWMKIKSMNLNDQNDQQNIGSIISNQNQPQLVPAVSGLHQIMRKADYVCSGEYQNKKLAHTALHKDIYTHFTSPLRRYIDIVVHRMVKAALLGNKPPYSVREMSDICHHSSVQSSKSKEFEIKTRALQLALQVKQFPMKVHSVIESVSEKNMMVGFSFYPRIVAAQRRCDVMFRLLKPIGRPEVDDDKKHARLRWKERIFHTMTNTQLCADDIRSNKKGNVKLNTERFIVKVSAPRWTAMNEAVDKGDMVTLSQLIHEEEEQHLLQLQKTETLDAKESLKSNKSCPVVQEVTCELGLGNLKQKRHHYVEFKREFAPGDVLQVQLQAGLQRGLMTPKVTLVNVTPMLDFCTEHRKDAVQCFAEIVDRRPSRVDINTYQATWLPIIEMMTSYNSVYGNETALIHGVQIEWQSDRNENSKPSGYFNLPVDFCRARHVNIFSPKGSGLRNDYLCIRYHDNEQISTTSDPQTPSIRDYQEPTFVAHAYVIDTNEEAFEDRSSVKSTPEFLTVVFEVNQCSSPFPSKLLTSSTGTTRRYTVEVIPKPVPDRRLERGIQRLDKAPQAIQDICLLKPPKTEDTSLPYDLTIQGSPFPKLNESQTRAVRSALNQPFTVIQGPPGTGKTMTGAYLVHFFTKENQVLRNTGNGRPQVMYCGPSNKSVDVIAKKLKEFDRTPHHKLSLVRIYSESIEYKSFPPPVEPGPGRKMDSEDVHIDPDLKDISLHYRIRRHPNSKAEVIRAFEKQFGQGSGLTPSDKDLLNYKKNIDQAEREELSKHQVILCTCNTSGQYRVRRYTNIIQCIVDEAGMCNEPETLIPLVSTKPRQIVLIGDHKQLRPIIQETTAQQLGMEISLLERYSKDMEMLVTQYRMHPAICKFPSDAFYDGKLETANSILSHRGSLRHKWPGGDQYPMAFCHTVGREETLTVHTEEGNEMSKANSQEVYQVVRIARTLVNYCKVKPERIVILTQYQLQRKKIELALKPHQRERASDQREQASDIDVRTVIKSQGSEWDFVIISTVRSLPRIEIEENPTLGWRKHNLGFIADDHQMNVALTRARRGLILVGNKYLLQTDKRWNDLLKSYTKNRCVIDANDFLPKKK